MYEFAFKILNMSITATFTALAVILLRLLLKKAPRWISYALWSVVLFRLLCPVSFTLPVSLLPSGAVDGTSLEKIMDDYTGPVNIYSEGSNQYQEAVENGVQPVQNGEYVVTANDGISPPLTIYNTWLPVFAVVWLLGLGGMLLYSIVSYVLLKRRVSDATLLEGNVFETDAITSPFLCGLLRPRIYLSVGLPEPERGYVLLHERTHIRRRDYLIKPLAFLVLSVHWFNPVIWLSFRLMSLDMEMSCDERVIRDFGWDETVGYGTALLHLSVKRPILAGSPLAFGEDGSKGRIRNVLNYKKSAFWVIVAAVTVVAAAAVCLLANPRSADEMSFLKKDAVYRNGLYFVTSEVENDEANAVLKNNVIYYDGWIRGDIQITDDMTYEYSEDKDSSDEIWDTLNNKYSFTWSYETTEHGMIGNGRSLRQGEDEPIVYGRHIDEYLAAGEEDVLVSIYITDFEDPLQFIVPADGTAPKWGMLYGTFSPCGIVYLSPDLSVISEELLESAKEAVFTVLPEEFSVSCAADADVIGEASYDGGLYSHGRAFGDTIDVIIGYGGDLESKTINVSDYTSKVRYSVHDSDFDSEYGYYSIFLMNDETWIGRWNWYNADGSDEIRCDYIFRVKPADTGAADATD